jgi:DNA-binding SARP family transcriptional activator
VPTTIRLLGRPSVEVDGDRRTLPGHKPSGLFAYLLLTRSHPTRRAVAELLWTEADDPLRALRWALLQVRRAIGADARVVDRDGRLVVELGRDAKVDAHLFLHGDLAPDEIDALGIGDLLEGLFFDDAPAFEQWLTLERQRVGSAVREALRWAATLLARTEPQRALRFVERAVALDPLNDSLHELAVDIHVSRGDRVAAQRYLETVQRTYRAELGAELPATVGRPLQRPAPVAVGVHVPPEITAKTLLGHATARLDAGDYAGAEDAARRAASEAARSADPRLEARALAVLGGVLVHSVRGRDREAIGLLTRTFQLATESGELPLAGEAAREIGYVAFLAADCGSAEVSLRRAVSIAEQVGDQIQRGQALTYIGGSQIDRGEVLAAERTLRDALASLDAAGERRFRAFTLSFLARALIVAGRAAEGDVVAREAIDAARGAGWHSVLPWIQVQLGEAELALGRTEEAAAVFSEAFALGTEIADPCWEALSLRGLAQVEVRRGSADRARAMLAEAHDRCTRVPDSYWWVDAAILTDLVELERGGDRARLDAALRLARRGPMPDLSQRLLRYTPSQTQLQTAR